MSIIKILLSAAAGLFFMALYLLLFYGVIVIVFRYAFGIELWNPFGG